MISGHKILLLLFLLLIGLVLIQPVTHHARYGGNISYFEWPVFGQITNELPNKEKDYEINNEEYCAKKMIHDSAIFLLGSIVTAVVGLIFGVLTANRNRRNDAIKTFSVFIAIKQSELDSIHSNDDWRDFYLSGRREMMESIFRIVPHLSKDQRDAFGKIWNEYKSGETQSELEKAASGGSDVLGYALEADATGIKAPRTKSEIIHDLLKKMDDTARQGLEFKLEEWLYKLKKDFNS